MSITYIKKMFGANTCESIILIWFIIQVNAAFFCPDCKNKSIPIRNRISCDNDDDCDGDMEEDSEYEVAVNRTNNCKWKKGKYLCEDNLKCVDFNETCNGKCDCDDCSDEKRDCLTDQEMEEYTRTAASRPCFKTPVGPHCCSEFDSLCHECGKNECEQKCIEFLQEPKCLCDENYTGVNGTNNRECINKDVEKNTLIYSTGESIRVLDLFTNKSQVIRTEIIESTALTAAHDHIYYANFTNGTGHIFKTDMNFNKTEQVTKSDSKILSIAIDWITNTTYYSTNTSKIVACSKDGKICNQLKSCNARSIGLAPRFGLLFWVQSKNNTDTSQYTIKKSGMDGSDEISLTNCDTISWPTTISVDELTEKIYFWTSLLVLSYVSFDGNDKIIFLPNTYPSISRVPFTIFEKKVYFSFSKSNQIRVTNDTSKLYTATLQMASANSTSISHLYAYNPRLQRTKISNPCIGICTDGLCLLRPSSSRPLNYTCFRSDTFTVPSQTSQLTSNKHEPNFGDIVTYVFVALVLIFFLIIMVKNLYNRWKKELSRNIQAVETCVPLESCENNEPVSDDSNEH